MRQKHSKCISLLELAETHLGYDGVERYWQIYFLKLRQIVGLVPRPGPYTCSLLLYEVEHHAARNR
jgi:hypothetical protein